MLRLRTHALQQQIRESRSSSSSGGGSSPLDHGSSSSGSAPSTQTSGHQHADQDTGVTEEEEEGSDADEEQDPRSTQGRVPARRRGTVYRKSNSRAQQNPVAGSATAAAAAARDARKARSLLLRALNEEVEAIDFCMEAVAEVARGSDLHVSLAEQRLRAAELAFVGADRASSAMMEAERCCYDAWSSRYGQLSFGGYTRLLAAKRSLGVC